MLKYCKNYHSPLAPSLLGREGASAKRLQSDFSLLYIIEKGAGMSI
jgi:hypothetical protein